MKYYYCPTCMKIFEEPAKCKTCSQSDLKELIVNIEKSVIRK